MIYRVNEIFTSFQGEGLWKGTPMNFIRMSGCNLTCPSCDTNFTTSVKMDSGEIIEALDVCVKRVVITGGEPTFQDLEPLVITLASLGFKVHLETNGTRMVRGSLLRKFSWIAISPKVHFGAGFIASFIAKNMAYAHEVKFPIASEEHLTLAENFRKDYNEREDLIWWLHPWHNDNASENDNAVIMDYCLPHASRYDWRLDSQLHKIWKVR